MFSGKTALWLSPDGNKLAYVRFDDTTVRRMLIPIYGIPGAPDFQYPAELPVNYPKVKLNIHIIRLQQLNICDINLLLRIKNQKISFSPFSAKKSIISYLNKNYEIKRLNKCKAQQRGEFDCPLYSQSPTSSLLALCFTF